MKSVDYCFRAMSQLLLMKWSKDISFFISDSGSCIFSNTHTHTHNIPVA